MMNYAKRQKCKLRCDECNRSYGTMQGLRNHKTRAHSGRGETFVPQPLLQYEEEEPLHGDQEYASVGGGPVDYNGEFRRKPDLSIAQKEILQLNRDAGLHASQTDKISKWHNKNLSLETPVCFRRLKEYVEKHTATGGERFVRTFTREVPAELVKGGAKKVVNVRLNDPLWVAAELLNDETLAKGMLLKGNMQTNADGKRVYDELNTGDVWLDTEKWMEKQPHIPQVIP